MQNFFNDLFSVRLADAEFAGENRRASGSSIWRDRCERADPVLEK